MNGTRSCGTQCQSSSRNTGVQTKRLSTEGKTVKVCENLRQ